jgi:major vault protein
MVDAIGKDTLVSISKAGPEMKAKMLKGLGLKGFLVTDGKNPINLFNTANGMLGKMVK